MFRSLYIINYSFSIKSEGHLTYKILLGMLAKGELQMLKVIYQNGKSI